MNVTRVYILVKVLEAQAMTWVFSTYVLFLLEHDLNLEQVTWINGFYMFSGFILEPFTGSIADRYGQKKIYLIGGVIKSMGLLIYGLSAKRFGFMGAELVVAIGATLISQALETWLRNQIGVISAHSPIAQAQMWGKYLSIPAALIGGYVGAKYGLQYPWFLAAASGFASVGIAYFLLQSYPEVTKESNGGLTSEIRELWRSISQSMRLIGSRSELRFVVIVNMISMAAFQSFNMFWPVIFSDLSGSEEWLGVVWAFVAIFSGIGLFFASKCKNINRSTVGFWLLMMAIPMLPIGFYPFLQVAVVGFMIHEIPRGGIRPIMGTYSNEHIPDEIRSTASSFMSASVFLGSMIGLLISGKLTAFLSPTMIWTISAIVLAVLAIYAMFGVKIGRLITER